jgi:predicted RNA-binding protein Jag
MAGDKSGEFRGKSVEAAISAGLAALQLTREKVDVEVIRPGSRGVLGLGAEDSVVRLTELRPGAVRATPEVAPHPTVEPRPAPAPKPEQPPAPKAQVQSRPEPSRASSGTPAELNDKELAAAELGKAFLSGLLERMDCVRALKSSPRPAPKPMRMIAFRFSTSSVTTWAC